MTGSTIAFLGLGAMGAEMARHLADGHALRVWNRSARRVQSWIDAGGRALPCDTPAAAAAGAGFVLLMVADDEASRSVLLGPQGVLETAAAGTVVIDSSTTTPSHARAMASAASSRGIEYLDAPVSGSIAQARGRELVFMVGGSEAAYARAEPLLATLGRMARRVGASGSGAALKLVNNMLSGTMSAALAESIAVAEAAGLDPAVTLEILAEGATGSRLLKSKIPKMTGRDFTPQFQLALMEKDLRYFLALAQEADRPAPLASVVRSQYQAARRAELGGLDVAALYLYVTGQRAARS